MTELKHDHKRPLLPQGIEYLQQQLCKTCGKDIYVDDLQVGGVVVRTPCEDPIHCDWCEYTHFEMRGMGIHVCLSDFPTGIGDPFRKNHPHKDHPEFKEEWLKIHEDGIDFEWREENRPMGKFRSPIP